MRMTRRTFLKTLAASAGIVAVPSVLARIPGTEPEWFIEEFDCGYSLGVGAKWPSGERRAVLMEGVGQCAQMERKLCIAYGKQALRQWYADRQNVVRVPLPARLANGLL